MPPKEYILPLYKVAAYFNLKDLMRTMKKACSHIIHRRQFDNMFDFIVPRLKKPTILPDTSEKRSK